MRAIGKPSVQTPAKEKGPEGPLKAGTVPLRASEGEVQPPPKRTQLDF